MKYDIVIVGAGASGLMLASLLKNRKICLLESNAKIGAKIRVSGGAKCNITNKYMSEKHYLGHQTFVRSILKNFNQHELLAFLNQHHVKPKIVEKIVKGTYFCNSAQEVTDMFSKLISHVDVKLNCELKEVTYNQNYTLHTSKGKIECEQLVMASGGLSYPSLGASSIAFDVAKQFGHTVQKLTPALVGFTVQKEQFWFKQLSGLSLPTVVKVGNKEFEGSFLFAHKGCSGPVILNASLFWEKGQLSIDFLPQKALEKFMKSNKHISSALPLPKRFVSEFLKSVELKDQPISALSSEDKDKLMLLKNYAFSPAGNFGYTKAEVTKGGVCTSQIDELTLQSKLQKNLYFLGECLDVTGELGGYNFQFAFSSAVTCSKSI